MYYAWDVVHAILGVCPGQAWLRAGEAWWNDWAQIVSPDHLYTGLRILSVRDEHLLTGHVGQDRWGGPSHQRPPQYRGRACWGGCSPPWHSCGKVSSCEEGLLWLSPAQPLFLVCEQWIWELGQAKGSIRSFIIFFFWKSTASNRRSTANCPVSSKERPQSAFQERVMTKPRYVTGNHKPFWVTMRIAAGICKGLGSFSARVRYGRCYCFLVTRYSGYSELSSSNLCVRNRSNGSSRPLISCCCWVSA